MFEASSQAVELPHDDDVSFTLLAQTHHFVQGWTGFATAAGPVHKCAAQLPVSAGSIFTQFRELHLRSCLSVALTRAYKTALIQLTPSRVAFGGIPVMPNSLGTA